MHKLQPHRLSHVNNSENKIFNKRSRERTTIINICYYSYHLPSISNVTGLSQLLFIFRVATMISSFADITEAEM